MNKQVTTEDIANMAEMLGQARSCVVPLDAIKEVVRGLNKIDGVRLLRAVEVQVEGEVIPLTSSLGEAVAAYTIIKETQA